jgi:hypothetical protein
MSPDWLTGKNPLDYECESAKHVRVTGPLPVGGFGEGPGGAGPGRMMRLAGQLDFAIYFRRASL